MNAGTTSREEAARGREALNEAIEASLLMLLEAWERREGNAPLDTFARSDAVKAVSTAASFSCVAMSG